MTPSTELQRPSSKQHCRDRSHLKSSTPTHQYVTPSYPRPDYKLVADHASGVWITDPDGNVFLDCNAGVAVCSTGHCHPEVVAAIQKQVSELIHLCGTDFYYRHMPAAWQKAQRDRPDRRADQNALCKQRRRGHRNRSKARDVSHAAAEIHLVLMVRSTDARSGLCGSRQFEKGSAARLYAAGTGRRPHSVSE